MERITVAEFHKRLKAQGVSSAYHFALKCPMCSTTQSMASLIAAGATADVAEKCIGFSCEGRFNDAGSWPSPRDKSTKAKKRRNMRGCDWTLGGFFGIHKLEVVTDDGLVHPWFVVASPEEALALEASLAQGIVSREAIETPPAAQPERQEAGPAKQDAP